jgi:ribosomal protein S18 acetylase RimI-like enzyme
MTSPGRIQIRPLSANDAEPISSAFKLQGWNKSEQRFQLYFRQQQNGERVVLLAFIENKFCGYVTIKWLSDYPTFREGKIPEISDLNVLKKYQRAGIGRSLMAAAENVIFEKGAISGLGVGLLSDYGAAQRLYNKLGYKPDGLGITYQNVRCEYGSKVEVDDDLVLWMTKHKP